MTHPFVYRTIPASHIDAGEVVEIDERIAPLIDALWLAGFETCLSCQGGDGRPAWVEFSDAAEAKRFVRIATTGTEALEVWRVQPWPAPCVEEARAHGVTEEQLSKMIEFPPEQIEAAMLAVLASVESRDRA